MPRGYPRTAAARYVATMYRIGHRLQAEFVDLTGRPIPILSTGEPIRELL
jgi:hypothetical protein